jgi:uncharacterized repeat protein (TIGR01451 family)
MLNFKMIALASACLIASGTGFAHAAEPVTSTLTVHRVAAPGGQEQFEPAATAKPGDTLLYTLDLHNGGVGTVHGLMATLPIPAGTELIDASALPAAAQASLDGRHFAAVPLKRLAQLADGSTREVLVPVSEYRFLQWAARDVGANQDLKVSVRVRVDAVNSTLASLVR